MNAYHFHIDPVSAPRMTQRDKFSPSKAVSRYFAFRNELKYLAYINHLEEIPVCVGYRLHGKETSEMPAVADELKALEPVYRTAPGWFSPTAGITDYGDLPQRARDYLEFLETSVGVEIGCISTGPKRDETIVKPGSKLSKLLG